jgi:hypothetical protein
VAVVAHAQITVKQAVQVAVVLELKKLDRERISLMMAVLQPLQVKEIMVVEVQMLLHPLLAAAAAAALVVLEAVLLQLLLVMAVTVLLLILVGVLQHQLDKTLAALIGMQAAVAVVALVR